MDNQQTLNYFNLKYILKEAKTKCQELFLRQWESVFKSQTDANELGDYFKTNQHKLKSLKPIQLKALLNGDTNQWDLTLFAIILLTEPFKDKTTNKYVQKIIEVRNKVAHNDSNEISNAEFEILLEKLENSLKSLGVTENDWLTMKNNFLNKDQTNDTNQKQSNETENEKANDLIKLANFEIEKQNFSKAVTLLSSALMCCNRSSQSSIYFSRSSARFLMYKNSNRNDLNLLELCLLDAKTARNVNPFASKNYELMAEIYLEMNEMNKSQRYYEKAWALNIGNENIKNSLAFVKTEIGIRERQEHLTKDHLPLLTDEKSLDIIQMKSSKMGLNIDKEKCNLIISKSKDILEKEDPNLKDVWLAHEYRDGSKEVKQNYATAASYYGKAAQNGNAEAQYNLALLHTKGLGVKVDFKTAISLLKLAAAQCPKIKWNSGLYPNTGVMEAQHTLGLSYQKGIYVEANARLAVEWYERAIENGSSNSANNLGILYMNGDYVERDLNKAERFLLFAHKLSNNQAADNLVELYLLKEDADNAELWQKRACESKSFFAMTRNDEIKEKIKKTRALKNIERHLPREFAKINNNLNKMFLTAMHAKKVHAFQKNSFQINPSILFEFASKGSETAQNLLCAFLGSQTACEMLDQPMLNKHEFISLLSKAYSTESLACCVTNKEAKAAIKILEQVIAENDQIKSDLDCDARVCYMFLTKNIHFISYSIEKYSDALIMRGLRGCLLCFEEKHEKALDDFKYILSKKPDDLESLYHMSAALRILDQRDMAVISYKRFLETAPIDHRKVPESYYALAVLSTSSKEFKEYYQKGLTSEQHQLPIFLPYKSNTKQLAGCFFDNKPSEEMSNINIRNSIINDIERKRLIIDHRTFIKSIREQPLSSNNFSVKPPKKQKATNSSKNLKPIYFRDIDFTFDHILEDTILGVTIIHIPYFTQFSLMILVTDLNGYAERVAIYDRSKTTKEHEEMYKIGCEFSIQNPYVRMAADGAPMIRIDDPASIILTKENPKSPCTLCLKENSKFQCSKCSKAKYCSKECQIDDWKIFKHQYICF